MVPHTPGVIIAFNAMAGVILLPSKGVPNIDYIAKSYVTSESDDGFWFAGFEWSAVTKQDQSIISARRGDRLIRDVLLGRPVLCNLERAPKWRAVRVHIEFNGIKYGLPFRRLPDTLKGDRKKDRCGRRGNSRTTLNGETGSGGIVIRPAGGQKPGSYRQ